MNRSEMYHVAMVAMCKAIVARLEYLDQISVAANNLSVKDIMSERPSSRNDVRAAFDGYYLRGTAFHIDSSRDSYPDIVLSDNVKLTLSGELSQFENDIVRALVKKLGRNEILKAVS